MLYTIADGEFQGVQITLGDRSLKEISFMVNNENGDMDKVTFRINHTQRILLESNTRRY